VIFIPEDIRENGVFSCFRIGNQSHRNAGNRFNDLDAGIHQGQAASADRSHRGRTVGFEDIGYDTDRVGIDVTSRNNRLEGAHSQVAMADLTAAGPRMGFTSPVENPGKL